MKDNVFFKIGRFTQSVTLRLAPFLAILSLLDESREVRLAIALLASWAMVVTSILTIKPPQGLWKKG
jgi:hypothetical protein